MQQLEKSDSIICLNDLAPKAEVIIETVDEKLQSEFPKEKLIKRLNAENKKLRTTATAANDKIKKVKNKLHGLKMHNAMLYDLINKFHIEDMHEYTLNDKMIFQFAKQQADRTGQRNVKPKDPPNF